DADAHTDRHEQQDRDRGVAGEVIPMPYPAAFAADARQLPVGVIEEIRHDQQQRAQVHPTIGSLRQRRRCCNAKAEANRGEVVGPDAGVLQWGHEPAREARIPWTLGCWGGLMGNVGHEHGGAIALAHLTTAGPAHETTARRPQMPAQEASSGSPAPARPYRLRRTCACAPYAHPPP